MLEHVGKKFAKEDLEANAAARDVDDHEDLEGLAEAVSSSLERHLVDISQTVLAGHLRHEQVRPQTADEADQEEDETGAPTAQHKDVG